MAEQRKTSRQEPSAAGTEGDLALAEWADFARQEEEERRVRRWSVGVAALLHLGFAVVFGFFGALPTIGYEVEREKQVYVVRPVRFRPPPPRQEQILKPIAKKIPVPDPTPYGPEPIVNLEELDLEIDPADIDLIFGPPEAPPIAPAGPIPVGGEVRAPVKISGPVPV
ncbi:MAG: hypothetical protein ACRD2Z_00410 [Thermoanaerobaculia bacterium]